MSLEQLHPAGQRLNLEPPCASHQEADEEIEWLGEAWGSELDPDEVFDCEQFCQRRRQQRSCVLTSFDS